jgi:hypothetical protein
MSRKGSAAVHGCVGRESAAKARRSFDAHPHAFEVGSDHRSRGRFGADVDVASLPFKLISLFSSMAGHQVMEH